MKKLILLILLFISIISSVYPMKIDRVILSTNTNPGYSDFWPIVATSWKKRIGVKPTLALICDGDIKIDESLGDVIKFDPIPGVPVSFQATTIRLFLPAYFPDDVCILSDIDMLPIEKSYFFDSLTTITDDSMFIVYNDKTYNPKIPRYPICYNVAKGSTFKELFGVIDVKDIPNIIKRWYKATTSVCLGLRLNEADVEKLIFQTDERMLSVYLSIWKDAETRLFKLGRTPAREINRQNWSYDPKGVKTGFYQDAHLLRPYSDPRKKQLIDQLLNIMGLDIDTKNN